MSGQPPPLPPPRKHNKKTAPVVVAAAVDDATLRSVSPDDPSPPPWMCDDAYRLIEDLTVNLDNALAETLDAHTVVHATTFTTTSSSVPPSSTSSSPPRGGCFDALRVPWLLFSQRFTAHVMNAPPHATCSLNLEAIRIADAAFQAGKRARELIGVWTANCYAHIETDGLDIDQQTQFKEYIERRGKQVLMRARHAYTQRYTTYCSDTTSKATQ